VCGRPDDLHIFPVAAAVDERQAYGTREGGRPEVIGIDVRRDERKNKMNADKVYALVEKELSGQEAVESS
jgi:hypothetical protein